MPQTKSARRLLAGAVLILLAVASVAVVRGTAPAYQPEAPAYRQRGPADAKVTLVVFSDFQCPHCRAAVEPTQRIERLFEGRLRVVFKHKPWPSHRWAKDAAQAAECAGRAGRFWEYHDLLFSRQQDWAKDDQAPALFSRYAKESGVDKAGFEACLRDPASLSAVDKDLADARDRWINSTPTFFINGRRFVGSRQLGSLGLNRIEDLLKR